MSSLEQKMVGLRMTKDDQPEDNRDKEIEIPGTFKCPISLELMRDPVILLSGITYERDNIEKWFQLGNVTCPVTKQELDNLIQIPNHTLRKMIQAWCVENKDNGLERIPTPKVPITPVEISETLHAIQASFRRLDQYKCLESLQKIEKRRSESERNRVCFIDHGTASVLADAFDVFANDSYEKNGMILGEILSVLNWMFPLSAVDKTCFGSHASLRCMVWFLRSNDASVKRHAAIILQDVSTDKHATETLGDIEGVHATLFDLIKIKACPIVTKAALVVTFNMVSLSSCSDKNGTIFVEMGIISTLLETIIDSDRSLCEKALGVFDKLCFCEAGIQEAYNNDLTMPVILDKLLRTSHLATEFSVSALWRLCKYKKENSEEKAALQALQLGAFQKLVLLLQIGCGQKTKEKATELLKILNPLRPGKECIDPIDFKNLKREF